MNSTKNAPPRDFSEREGAEATETTSATRILRVAEKLFLKKGYNATTIREIAAASKVSNATIVKYFGGKPELFVCMVAEATQRLIGATAIDFTDLPEQGLKAWGTAALRLLFEPRMVMAAQHLYSDVSMLPKLAQAYYMAGPASLATDLSLQLKRWAEMGQLPDQDFLIAAEWFMHLLGGGVYQRVLIGLRSAPTESEIEAAAHEATRIFLAAFGPANASG